MPAPLAHLRVVDLADLRGALAARLLADLGADVVKIEPPGGDPGRLRPPFAGGVPGKDRSLPFLYRNANKRGVTLDLHDAAGWRRFLGLCENADVLIENLGPDAARRHGLAPTEIRERHPHLVHVPLADYARVYPMVNPSPRRNADGAYHVLRTADGHVRVLPGTPRHWRAFLTLVRNPEALAGPEWETPVFRLANGDVIRLLAADALGDRKRTDVLAEGRALGLPIAPVNRPDDFVGEEQTRGRGYFRATGFLHLGEAPFAP